MITEKTYTQASTAWPRNIWAIGKDDWIKEVVLITMSSNEGWHGDFSFEWVELSQPRKSTSIRLLAFDDSWTALYQIRKLLLDLDGSLRKFPPTPEEFIATRLEPMGFKPSEYHGQLLVRTAKP
jgi:hypothetical protein